MDRESKGKKMIKIIGDGMKKQKKIIKNFCFKNGTYFIKEENFKPESYFHIGLGLKIKVYDEGVFFEGEKIAEKSESFYEIYDKIKLQIKATKGIENDRCS